MYHIALSLHLWAQEDGSVPLDFPEEDDESDPISMIDWVTDKVGGVTCYLSISDIPSREPRGGNIRMVWLPG
jgi:hypothetical protein